MDLQNIWTIILKEFKTFRKKPSIIYSMIISPLLVGTALPLFLGYAYKTSINAFVSSGRLDGFVLVFVIIAITIPTTIASYSFVGEKVQKTLEPLLATPATDGEILAGKVLSAVLPSILAVYAGATIFMGLTDQDIYGRIGYLYFPNWSTGLILLVMVPLASLVSVELNVILSERMNDVRAVTQFGALLVIPLMGFFAAAEEGVVPITLSSLLSVSAIMLVAVIALFYLSKASFRREEILTRWK